MANKRRNIPRFTLTVRDASAGRKPDGSVPAPSGTVKTNKAQQSTIPEDETDAQEPRSSAREGRNNLQR